MMKQRKQIKVTHFPTFDHHATSLARTPIETDRVNVTLADGKTSAVSRPFEGEERRTIKNASKTVAVEVRREKGKKKSRKSRPFFSIFHRPSRSIAMNNKHHRQQPQQRVQGPEKKVQKKKGVVPKWNDKS